MTRRPFLLLLLISWCSHAGAQEVFREMVRKSYGTDQQLINGIQFSNQYGRVEGHPYLLDEHFKPASLVVHGQWYHSVPIRYNLYSQRVEIQYVTTEGNRNQIITVPGHLASFLLSGSEFQHVDQPGIPEGYYQVVRKIPYECYIRWNKELKVAGGSSARPYRFSPLSSSYWLRVEDHFHRFHNRKTFLEIFAGKTQKRIAKILRIHDIRLPMNDPQECENELQKFFQLIGQAGISMGKTPVRQPSSGFDMAADHRSDTVRIDSARLITRLPEYFRPAGMEDDEGMPEDTVSGRSQSLETTLAERKYLDGRRVRQPQIFRVGTRMEQIPGRQVLVHGSIQNSSSGEPVIGATIYVRELSRGISTNSDGEFHLVILPGAYDVECLSMGMERLHFNLEVFTGGDLDLEMNPALIPLEEVVVRSDRHSRVRGTSMGMERLNYQVLKEVPLVMGERDILQLVKMLPGVQSMGEGTAGYQVRGGSTDQNMIYVNRIPVYNSSHFFGFFSAFNSEIISDFTLNKGNPPASQGGRLASFFDIRTRQGNMKRFSARGGISMVSAYATAEGPVIKDKSSIQVSARTTYSDWILRRMEDPLLRSSRAGFNDFSATFAHKWGERSRFRLFGYASNDRFKLGSLRTYSYGNRGVSGELNHRFTPRLTGDFTLVYSRYHFSGSSVEVPSAGYEHAFRIDHYEGRSDMKWLSLGKHQVTFGAGGIYYHLDRGQIGPYGNRSLRSATDLGVDQGLELALYGADEVTLTERLTLYGGVRISGFLLLGPSRVRTYQEGVPRQEENVTGYLRFGPGSVVRTYYRWEPRINFRYLTGELSSLKLSYSRGYQYLFMLSNTVSMAPADQWKLCDYHIRPQFMDQLSAGFFRDLRGGMITASVELYRKWGGQIVDIRDWASFTENPYTESEILQGDMDAYGMEFMIRKDRGALNGWITYNYSRSFLQVDHASTGEQINRGLRYPSLSDRPHSVAMVVNLKGGRRLSFSANMVYTSGRPTTFPVSLYYEYEIPYLQYSLRNRYRIPDYFRLDLSMNIEGNLKREKLFHSYWMVGIYNLTGRDNAYSVYFRNERESIRGYKLSIFARPVATLSWNIKFGNYASD